MLASELVRQTQALTIPIEGIWNTARLNLLPLYEFNQIAQSVENAYASFQQLTQVWQSLKPVTEISHALSAALAPSADLAKQMSAITPPAIDLARQINAINEAFAQIQQQMAPLASILAQVKEYYGNNRSRTFHRFYCPHVRKIKPANLVFLTHQKRQARRVIPRVNCAVRFEFYEAAILTLKGQLHCPSLVVAILNKNMICHGNDERKQTISTYQGK